MRQARYIEVDLRAPGLGVLAALEAAQEIVNNVGGSGWSFGHRASDFRLVIYREFDTKKAFREALAAIRQRVGAESSRARFPHLPDRGSEVARTAPRVLPPTDPSIPSSQRAPLRSRSVS